MKAIVSIGSNILPDENVKKSVMLLARAVNVRRLSAVYRTEPEGRPEQPMYYNCVAAIETDLMPEQLHYTVLRTIEDRLGRVRTGDKFAARPIDLDLILCSNGTPDGEILGVSESELLSHPYLAVPLAEIEPGLLLREAGLPLAEVVKTIPVNAVDKLAEYTDKLQQELAIMNATKGRVICSSGH